MSRLKEISCVPLHRFASSVVFCDLWLLVTVLKMLKVEVGQALLSDKGNMEQLRNKSFTKLNCKEHHTVCISLD